MKNFIHHEFGELRQINSEAGRVYQTPTGLRYPSVTAVTGMLGKDAIIAWRKKVGEEAANKISQRASKRGTAIHSLCEDYIHGRDLNINPFDHDMFNTIRPHLDAIDNVHALESRLYSDHLAVAGTVDCIAEYEGRLSVIDFKTSSRVKTSDEISNYFMQCSAYAVAFEERTGIPVPRLTIIMGVDDHDALIFTEKRDRWIDSFIKLRSDYRNWKGV